MRRLTLRLLAGLFAASWLVFPGFGLADLAVTWDPDWPQVLEAGWGLFASAVVAAAFALVAVRPQAARAGVVQLAVAAAALAVSALAAWEAPLAFFAVGLALQTAAVALLLRRDRAPVRLGRRVVSTPLLALGAAGLVPWLVYALRMWEANRDERPDADRTMAVDHYSVQGALALAFAALPVVAAARPDVRPFVPVCAGLAAAYLGLVSLAWSDAAGGLSPVWSAAALAWGLGLLAVALGAPAAAALRGRVPPS